jgi:hypothetical protein
MLGRCGAMRAAVFLALVAGCVAALGGGWQDGS